jgi:hypothetical protein
MERSSHQRFQDSQSPLKRLRHDQLIDHPDVENCDVLSCENGRRSKISATHVEEVKPLGQRGLQLG